jgi:hypothetical protein
MIHDHLMLAFWSSPPKGEKATKGQEVDSDPNDSMCVVL